MIKISVSLIFDANLCATLALTVILLVMCVLSRQILGDEDKRTRFDRGEDIDDNGMGMGEGGFNPFGGGGQQFTFHFEGGFPGGGGFHF